LPNLRKLGLLDSWLRQRFAELGVLKYEAFAAFDDDAREARPAL